MKIQLDHVQRLNLHALLGAQRGDVATIRRLWAIQDQLALSDDEEKDIELKREFVGGQDRVVWNTARAVPAKSFEFAESDLARIRAALETWAHYAVQSDRSWLEPLLVMLFTSGRVDEVSSVES